MPTSNSAHSRLHGVKGVRRPTFFDRCFRDHRGNIVLFQSPNLVSAGRMQSLFQTIGFGALFTWAWLEVFSGCNYFRRVLGVIVMIGLVVNRL